MKHLVPVSQSTANLIKKEPVSSATLQERSRYKNHADQSSTKASQNSFAPTFMFFLSHYMHCFSHPKGFSAQSTESKQVILSHQGLKHNLIIHVICIFIGIHTLSKPELWYLSAIYNDIISASNMQKKKCTYPGFKKLDMWNIF